jgi:hypothetical protein
MSSKNSTIKLRIESSENLAKKYQQFNKTSSFRENGVIPNIEGAMNGRQKRNSVAKKTSRKKP